MLSFKEMLEKFKQLVENENKKNGSNSGKTIKLKDEYFTDMEARYYSILERYKKTNRMHESNRNYCALAFFFEAVANWNELPIDIVDEKGIRISKVHIRKVSNDSLEDTLRKITFSLLVGLAYKILNIKGRYKTEELIKSLNMMNLKENCETLIPLFRNLSL